MLFTLPFAVVGVMLQVAFPSFFDVGGPSDSLRAISIAVSVAGVAIWLWSVALILIKVPRGELITTGPFAVVRHPIYTSVALLVLPWAGFLLDTWLGAVIGAALYLGTRLFAPREEHALSQMFGAAWQDYASGVKVPWL